MTLARGIYEDLSLSHRPPFVGGLAPLPLPQLSPAEYQVMCQLGAVETMCSGTTLVLEDAIGIQHYAEALAANALRFLLCECAWDNVANRMQRSARLWVALRRQITRRRGPASRRATVKARANDDWARHAKAISRWPLH